MPFIVATYVYLSSQGQRTHSARTNVLVVISALAQSCPVLLVGWALQFGKFGLEIVRCNLNSVLHLKCVNQEYIRSLNQT